MSAPGASWRCPGASLPPCETFNSTDVLFYTAKKMAKSQLSLGSKDRIVITGGNTTGCSGNTNLIKIEEI